MRFRNVRLYRKYYRSDLYSQKLFLVDSNYIMGNEFSRWVDSFDADMSLHMTLRPLDRFASDKKLKSMRAERGSELRVTGGRDARAEKMRFEIEQIDRLISSVAVGGNSLFDISLRVKVSAEQPTVLQNAVNRFLMSMNLLDFKFSVPPFVSKRLINQSLLSPEMQSRYLVDSKSIAQMLPIFLSHEPGNGILLGAESSTGLPVFMDQMQEASHNLLIIGETGSGKSFFGKLLLIRSLIVGLAKSIIILDPLDEYTPAIFDYPVSIVDTSAGEYFDFFDQYSEDSRLREMASFVTDLLVLDETEMASLVSLTARVKDASGFSDFLDQLLSLSEDTAIRNHLIEVKRKSFTRRVGLPSGEGSVVILKTPSDPGPDRDRQLRFALATARYLARSNSNPKIALIDEMHLFLNSRENSRLLANLFRNSRHFSTSVVGITQNSYDLEGTAFASTIKDNSIASFVFRTRSLSPDRNLGTFYPDELLDPELLLGGKNSDFSECLLLFRNRTKKIRIMATGYEKEVIDGTSLPAPVSPDQA